MASATSSGADDLRAAAADLDLVVAARRAREAADEQLVGVIRAVRDRRRVTVVQIAAALGVHERSVYKMLARDEEDPE